MRVGTADEAHLKGVCSACLTERHTVFQGIAHHVAAGEIVDGHRSGSLGLNLAVHGSEHGEIVASYLLERAVFVAREDPAPAKTIVPALGRRLVLDELDHRFEVSSVIGFAWGLRIAEHQAAGEVWIVRNGKNIASRCAVDAALAELLPEVGKHV